MRCDTPVVPAAMTTSLDKSQPDYSALLKLARFAERHSPQTEKRTIAGEALLHRFHHLAKAANLLSEETREPDNGNGDNASLIVSLPRVRAVFVHLSCTAGRMLIHKAGQPPDELTALQYNPLEARFEGVAPDGTPTDAVDALANLTVQELTRAWNDLSPIKPR